MPGAELVRIRPPACTGNDNHRAGATKTPPEARWIERSERPGEGLSTHSLTRERRGQPGAPGLHSQLCEDQEAGGLCRALRQGSE